MYIYQADHYCDDCIKLDAIKKPDYPQPWDTDDYPSYHESAGEVDSPAHCGDCGCPLDYSLTEEGIKYILESIRESIEQALEQGRVNTWDRIIPLKGTAEESMTYWHGQRHVEILRSWAEKLSDYSLEAGEQALVSLFLELSEKP